MKVVIIGGGFSARIASKRLANCEVTMVIGPRYVGPDGNIPSKHSNKGSGGLANWGGNLFFPTNLISSDAAVSEIVNILSEASLAKLYRTNHGIGCMLPRNFVPSLNYTSLVCDSVSSITPNKNKYKILLQSGSYLETDRVVVCTGASSRLTVRDGSLKLDQASSQFFDKEMFVEPTNLPIGIYTDISSNRVFTMHYVMRGGLFRRGLEELYLRIIHAMNKQYKLALKVGYTGSLIADILTSLKPHSGNVSLTTRSFSDSVYPWRQENGKWIHKALKALDVQHQPLLSELNRALHIDFRQSSEVLQWMERHDIAHDQYGEEEDSFKFGSVGYRILRVINTLQKSDSL